MGIGSKLSILLEKNDTNPNELAKQVGVSAQTIYSIIKRDSKKADIEVLLKIADILGVTVEYFVDDSKPTIVYSDTKLSSSDLKLLDKYHALDPYGQETVTIVLNREINRVKELNNIKLHLEATNKQHSEISYPIEFPTVDTEQPTRTLNYYQRLASAGTGQIVFDDVPVDLIEIPDIPEYKRVKYAIGVNGDSMEPLYYDGDILLVEPMPDVRINEMGIFIVDGESLVKKRGRKSLISLNKNKHYPEIPLNEETRCLGRVVDKISSSNTAFSVLAPEDRIALERRPEFPDEDESALLPPDISALDPADLAALEAGMKSLRFGSKP